uniref:Uncharacterized protein n=1 Tax=Clytia hemisphaerica TaxID=252671 RepID=A0A7M5XJ35_9CNID
VTTLNEDHHWHIVTIRAKRHKNSVEFQYHGTAGFAKNFIEEVNIKKAIKGAFENRFDREVTEYIPPNNKVAPREQAATSSPDQTATASSSKQTAPKEAMVATTFALEVVDEGDVLLD